MDFSSTELEGILADRLESVRKEKSVIREAIEDLEAKIKSNRKLITVVPREKDEELVAMLQRLEHTHATTPQTNADERDFMREKEKIRQKRKALTAYLKVQGEIDSFRAKLTDLRKTQAGLDDSINELHTGLRKVRVANLLKCNNSEIFEKKYTVESSKVSRIVGRGGSNLRNIESDHGVSIEIDNTGGIVRIMGTDVSIEAAHKEIMHIVETSVEEFPLSDEMIMCLLMDKNARVNEIQGQFNVRLDLSRAKNLCRITGMTDSVLAARAHINSLQSVRTDMLLDASLLSTIIGKGGANITALQDEFRVAINANRERNTVEVVGMRPDVSAALNRIKEIVEVNKEVEEIIKVEKHILMGCLMGGGSQVLRSVSRDFAVSVLTEGAKEDPLQSIKIKGPAGKVAQAKARIVQLVGEFISNSVVVEVADEIIPVILGKGGSGIKAMRERYPGSNIDIEGCSVHIQSNSEADRNSIRDEIEAICGANFSQSVTLDDNLRIQLLSLHGLETRNRLTKDLGLRLKIEIDNPVAKLRGDKEAVARGVIVLQQFMQCHTSEKVLCDEEDYPMLLSSKGAEESVARQLETRYGVEIKSNRKDLSLTIQGAPELVAQAKAALQGYLDGEMAHGSQLVELHRLVYAQLIGKGGANIAKMESELGVHFDILKARNLLRIRGSDPSKMSLAKTAVLKFMQSCRVSDTVAIATSLPKKEIDAIVNRASGLYQMEIVSTTTASPNSTANASATPVPAASGAASKGAATSKSSRNSAPAATTTTTTTDSTPASLSSDTATSSTKSFTLKGLFGLMVECKSYLEEQLTGICSYTLPILSQQFLVLEKQLLGSLKRLQDHCDVQLLLKENEVKLTGSVDAVSQGKKELMKLMEKYFPSTVSFFEIPSLTCLLGSFGDEFLAKMSASGVLVKIDRVQCSLLLIGAVEADLEQGRREVQRIVTHWQDCHVTVPIHPSQVPLFVGKAGASINALRKDSHAQIEINSDGTGVLVSGTSKEVVSAGKAAVEERIRQMAAERWEFTPPLELLPVLIGKQGANISKMRTDSGAMIDIEGSSIKVHGPEAKVLVAKDLIMAIVNENLAKVAGSKVVIVPSAGVGSLIGPKGATIKELQSKTDVRFDFDRVTNKCALKGT
jgi:rRNA processing protein Krr1/Pno1/predicted RNA-binding protein YlqC (UPF0109 family)